MSEAVFSISANITPQLDERELERQAQLMSRQLNGLLSKQTQKIGIQGDTRSFNEIKNQLQTTNKFTQGLQRSMGSLKNTIGDVPKRAKEGFLKLTDALDVTKRNLVGFGGTIRDTIRDTNKFKDAFENIAVSGGVFRELDGSFASTIAGIRSGTSALDQFAQRGDHLAQLFLPLTRTSAAAQLNLEGLQQTLEGVALTFKDAFKNDGKDPLSASAVSTGSLNAELNHMQRTFLRLGNILPKGSREQKAFFDTFEEAKAKGGMDDYVKGLVQQRDAANRVAGPLGKAKVALHLLSKESHESAKILRNETNQALVQIEKQFPGTVEGFDHFAARVRNLRDTVLRGADSFKRFQAGLAAVIPGQNLGITLAHAFDTTDAVGGANNFFDAFTRRFDRLRAEGNVNLKSIGKEFRKTFDELNVVISAKAKLNEITDSFKRLGLNVVFAAQFIKDDFNKALAKIVNASKPVIAFGQKVGASLRSAFVAFKGSAFATDMLKAFTRIGSGLKVMKQGASEVGAVLKDVFVSSKFGKSVMANLDALGIGFKMSIRNALEFGTKIKSGLNDVRSILKVVGGDIVNFGKGIGSTLIGPLRFAFDAIGNSGVGRKLAKMFDQISGQALKLGKSFGQVLTGPLLFGFDAIRNAASRTQKALKPLDTGFGKILEFGKSFGKVVTGPLLFGFDAIRSRLNKTFESFKNSRFAEPLLQGIGKIFTGFITVKKGAGDVDKTIGREFDKSGVAIRGKFTDELTQAQSRLGKFMDNMKQARAAKIGAKIPSVDLREHTDKAALEAAVKVFPTPRKPSVRSLREPLARRRREEPLVPTATAGPTEQIIRKGSDALEKALNDRREKIATAGKTMGRSTVAFEKGTLGGVNFEQTVGGALEAQVNAVIGRIVPLVAIGGRRIGVALSGGILAGLGTNASAIEAKIAELSKGAAQGTKPGKLDPGKPAIQTQKVTEPKTIQLPKITGAPLANFNLGPQLEANLMKGLPGVLGTVASMGNQSGMVYTDAFSGGGKAALGGGGAANLMAGFGIKPGNFQGEGAKSGSALVRGITMPFKQIGGVLSTVFRASLGKGPAEGVGALGKAAGLALLPVRLFSQAAGATLKAGLQLGTSALKVAGAAFAGFVSVAIATGVQFNSLQAVIRATLPVILGSAAASETLLKQINELNDTSPFARSAFLELTRVLAGFGVQAEKITPLIDAIQQAVAATGGGEQDLLELGQAFARLQSQGRLSLDIIQSFSSRGIDVIAILGQEFGKTQMEVRDMISNGLIPAGKAIDALTKGLKNKFDGATDAVAKNLPGALDRVKARTRDFGAELTRAFVSPTGGGAVIDLLNSFATVINKITKDFLPLLRPALESVANAITTMSTKAATFAKTLGSFEAGKLKEFAGGLDGMIGPLAALAALFPVLLQTLPIIGPAFASMVGGIPTATIAIAAFLLTLKPVREGLMDLFKTLAPIGGMLLPKMSAAFKSFGDAIGPTVGVFLKALGPIAIAAGDALGELFDQLGPIFDSFKRLFTALEPVITIIKNQFIAQFKAIQVAFKILGPVIKTIIDLIAVQVERVKPFIQAFADLTDKFQKAMVVKGIFEAISAAVADTVEKLKGFIGTINGILKFLHLPTIDIVLNLAGLTQTETGIAGVTKLTEHETEALKKQAAAANKTSIALVDGYNKAKKAAEDADAKVGQLTDQVKQQISSLDSDFNKVLDAAKAAKAAHEAVAAARLKGVEASNDVTKLEKERAKALQDTITPIQEVAAAERELARTRKGLIDLGREEADIQQRLADLKGEDAGDKRAALDRNIERAKISLNKARKDELDLINETNKATAVSVDLTGLTVDEIKSRLSLVRMNLAAQKSVKKPDDKTAQEKADEKTSAKLDVADSEQGLKDATKARQQFELDTSNAIRDNEERLIEINQDKQDKLLEEQAKLKDLNDLRNGETAQQKVILDFEDKIKDAKGKVTAAAKEVTAAIAASSLADLEFKSVQAEINHDVEAQAGFQAQIHALKKEGFHFDEATEGSLSKQAGLITGILNDLDAAQAAAHAATREAKAAALSTLFGQIGQGDLLTEMVQKGISNPDTLVGLKDLRENIAKSLGNIVAADAITKIGTHEPVILNDDQLKDILMSVSDEEGRLMGLGKPVDFRAILRAVLASIHLEIIGLASGFAPGEIHNGMNDGKGLVRMFEFGKEAVLPLTRKFDMQRVVNNPMVLPKILDALPRMSLPGRSDEVTTALSSIRSPIGRSADPAVDRRKEQREFAGTIGAAVKVAVMEALLEAGGSLGPDVDINVNSSSGNDIVIANEVRRQVERVLNKM